MSRGWTVCLTVALLPWWLGGCGTPVVAGVTLTELSAATTIISAGLTGKGLGEHVLDVVTGKDCRLIEGALRDDRELCEEVGSSATKSDFKGLTMFIEEPPPPPADAPADSLRPVLVNLADLSPRRPPGMLRP